MPKYYEKQEKVHVSMFSANSVDPIDQLLRMKSIRFNVFFSSHKIIHFKI